MVQMQMMNGSYGDADGLDGGAQAGVILGGALNGVTTMTAFNLQEHTSVEYNKVRACPRARAYSACGLSIFFLR